jgi:D-isomer specific 2-hydroxyacid dehydrogenase, catalytic domain
VPTRSRSAWLAHRFAITNKAPITAATLERLPALKLIAVAATGTDRVDKAACAARGVAVSNIRGYAINTVREHTFALILALRRNIVAYRESVLAGAGRSQGSSASSTIQSATCAARGWASSAKACSASAWPRSARHDESGPIWVLTVSIASVHVQPPVREALPGGIRSAIDRLSGNLLTLQAATPGHHRAALLG